MNDSYLLKAHFSSHFFLSNHRSLPALQEEVDMTKTLVEYYLFTDLFVRFLVFSLDVRDQGVGRDSKEPINTSPGMGSNQLG